MTETRTRAYRVWFEVKPGETATVVVRADQEGVEIVKVERQGVALDDPVLAKCR